MKRSLIIFALLLFAITASAQSYSSPGIPAGTTSLTPTFRTKAATPDSLAQIWLAIGGNKFYRMLSGMDVIVFDARVVQGLGTTSSKLTFRDTLLKPNWIINPADTLHPALTVISDKAQAGLLIKPNESTDGRAVVQMRSAKNNQWWEVGANPAGQNKSFGIRRMNGVALPAVDYLWYVEPFTDTSVFPHQVRFTNTRAYTPGDSVAYLKNGFLEIGPAPSGGGTTTNQFTAATSGGASPGTTFDGSVARTFDYSSFGAAPAFTATGSGVILSSGNLGLGGSTTSSRTINFNTHFLEFTGTDFGGTTGTTIFQGNGFSSNITNAGGDHYGINISTAQAQLNGNNGSGNVASVNASSNHADLVFTDGSGINSISSTDNGIHIGSTIDFKAAYYDDVYLLPTGNYIPSKRQVDSIAIAKADSISGGGGGGSFLPLTFTGDNTVAIGTHAMTINADDGAGNTSSILQHPTDVSISSASASNFANISITGATGSAFMGSGDAAGDNPNISITPTDVIIEYQRFDGMSKAIILDSLSNNGIRINDDSNIGLVGTTLFPVSGDPNQFVQAGNLPSTTIHTSGGLSGDGSVGTPVVLGGTITGAGGVADIQLNNPSGANTAAFNVEDPNTGYGLFLGGNGTDFQSDMVGGAQDFSSNSIVNAASVLTLQLNVSATHKSITMSPSSGSGIGVADFDDKGLIGLDGGGSAYVYPVSGSGAQYAQYGHVQQPITLTTTGTSGASTLVGTTLNIPQYAGASPGNPSGLLTFTASNGSNATYLRNDGLHAIDSTVVASVANHPTLAQLQTALNLKANLASPTFTGTVTIPNGGVFGTPTSINIANATGMTSGQVTTALGFTPIAPSDTTTAFANLVHINKAETILGPKTFNKAITQTLTALGTTQTEAQRWQNTTAAAVGAVQISPFSVWYGNNWSTGSTASVQFGFRAYTLPIQNSSGYNGEWHLQGLTALNTWADALKVDNGGTLTAVNFVSNGGEVNSGTFRNASSNASINFQTARTFNAAGNIIQFNPGSITNSSGLVIGLNATQTINQTSTASYTYNQVNLTETAVGSGGAKFVDYQVAGTSKYSVKDDGTINSAVLTASTPLQTDASKNIISSPVGQTTLVSGTKAITITGLTTSSKAFCQLVSQGGTVTTTQVYGAVCTTNTLTITALTTAGATDTTDTSVLNYFVVVQ